MDGSDTSEPRLRPMADGRYKDFAPVGQGGMGIVYWALDTELSRQIALKVIRPPGLGARDAVTPSAPLGLGSPNPDEGGDASFDGLRRRFLQEAWITGGMEHPGIVPVYELGETPRGVPYYTMRFIRGSRTLRSAIEELADAGCETRLDQLLESFLKICDTIRYAHRCGVIHRDLKPENVALGEYGEVVVLDWGLAKLKGALDAYEDPWSDRVLDMRSAGAFHTVASVLGTPGFLSPEAARGEIEALDERCDIYALGVMLFQILTGCLPIDAPTAAAYMQAVLTQAAPDPRALEPHVPARLATLCLEALALDPDDRPASADAFAGAVRAWRSEAAREREVQVLLGQAETALRLAPTHGEDELLEALDRVTAACGRILELDPEHAEAQRQLEHAHVLRERGIQARERHARRRTLVRIAGGVLIAGLVAAIVVAGLLEAKRHEAADARRLAEADRARAERVMNFMVFELGERLEPIGRLDVLAQLGATARQYYATLPSEGLSTKSLIGHTVTLRRLGDVYEARGGLPAALEAYRLAGDIAERVLAQDPDDPIGRYHRSLAEAKVGMALFRQGYATDAKRVLLAHRADVLRLLRDAPEHAEYLDAQAAAHAALGHVLRTEGRWEEAGRAFGEALAISTRNERLHPDEAHWTRLRLRRQCNVVRLLRDEGRLEEASAYAQSTLDECLRHMASEPRAADVRWMDLEAACRYGLVVAFNGLLGSEARIYAAAHEAYARLHALDPENDRWLFKVAQTRIQQSNYHFQRSDPERAFPFAADAFEIAKRLTRKDPTNASWQNLLITLCDQLARHADRSEATRHEGLAYRALAAEHARHLVQLDPANAKWRHILAYTQSRLGFAYLAIDDEEAHGLLTRAIAGAAVLVAENPTEYELVVLQALSRDDLASLESRRGNRAAALQLRSLALEELNRCWASGTAQREVAALILKLHEKIAATLTAGDSAARAEAARHLRVAREFVEAILEAPPAWPAARLRALEERRRRLARALEALVTAPDAPK